MANRVDCVTLSMDPLAMNVKQHGISIKGEEEIAKEEDASVEEEDNDGEKNIGDYAYFQYHHLDNMEDSFWHDFLHEVNNGSHSNSQASNQGYSGFQGPNQGHGDTQVPNKVMLVSKDQTKVKVGVLKHLNNLKRVLQGQMILISFK